MVADDANQENIISYLYNEDVSILESIKIIREVYDISLGEAKQIVSTSPSWSAYATAMDKEHEKLIEELKKDDSITVVERDVE